MGATKSKGKGPGVPSGASVTFCVNNVSFCMTMSLTDANNLLVALANAINNAATKKAKTGGGKGGKGGGGK